jgi:hypothetical protein
MSVVEVYYFSQMNNLPIESSRSRKGGIWFVFKDNNNWIRLWVGTSNGKEKFYYNNELTHEKQQRTKIKTSYTYTNKDGDKYELLLKAEIKLSNPGSVCTLSKNAELIGRFEMRQNKQFKKHIRLLIFPLWLIVLSVVLAINIGKVSYWWAAIPVFYLVVGIIYFIKNKIPAITMEDTTYLS